MKVICFGNQRGGIGKTSTAGNVANELRKHGRTLLLDADPQASLSTWFLEESGDSVMEALNEKDLDVITIREGLDLLPTKTQQSKLREWSDRVLPGETFAVHSLLDRLREQGYKYIVVDLHPEATSYLERRFISACDEVVTVLAADTFSFKGLDTFRGAIEEIKRKDRANFNYSKVVINMVEDRKVLHQVYTEELANRDLSLFQIPRAQDVANSQTVNKFLVEYNKNAKPVSEYVTIAESLA